MRYGHFDNEHREYVIERVDLPTSWTNYLGVENLAVVVNHTAGGYSFYKSSGISQNHTFPWKQYSNGPVGILCIHP